MHAPALERPGCPPELDVEYAARVDIGHLAFPRLSNGLLESVETYPERLKMKSRLYLWFDAQLEKKRRVVGAIG